VPIDYFQFTASIHEVVFGTRIIFGLAWSDMKKRGIKMYQIGKVVRSLYVAILIMAFLAFAAGISQSEEFCVDPNGGGTHTDLQSALTDAQSNGKDDITKVVQGTYIGNFTYDSSEGHNIILEGGYTEGCLERVGDPSNTILGGNGSGRALYLHNSNGGDITVEGFTIQNGKGAESGGGMWAKSDTGKITIFNNIITKNETTGIPGPGAGAGIWANCGSGSLTIANNTITDNDAKGCGGGVCVSGSGIDITKNTITYNIAGDSGGGIYFMSGNITIANNTITGNNATNYGGGVAFPFSSGTLINNTMTKNVAGAAGGGVSALASNLILTNNTIATNQSYTSGGGMHILSFDNKADVYNNIIRDNEKGEDNEGGDIYLEDPGTFNGFNNDYHDLSGTWTNQAGNIDDDPLFVDSENDDYHLQPDSPCIDKGTNDAPELPDKDKDGKPRIIDGDGDGEAMADMGAYEFGDICEGDFDGDKDVDGSDLAMFAADFGRTDCGSGQPCEGDFDNDGDVDGSDLAVFAANFGRVDCLP
jgi:parallel beta-helix repeat protein